MVNRGYPYEVILFTFKFKKRDILAAIQGKTFNDEKHKFNYIMVIVNNSINDIYKRYLRTLKDNNRPMIAVDDRRKRLENIFKVRDPLYREACDFIVDSSHNNVHDCVEQIKAKLKEFSWKL